MQFQILDKNQMPLTLSQLDKDAANLWNVVFDEVYYATPRDNELSLSWFDVIGDKIAGFGVTTWSDVIKSVWQIAKIELAQEDIKAILDNKNPKEKYAQWAVLKPYMELINLWHNKGYVPKGTM
jgi:hypothetical protein